jgi:hypothetical protein
MQTSGADCAARTWKCACSGTIASKSLVEQFENRIDRNDY